MKSPYAARLLQLHRELCEATRQADREAAAYLAALECDDEAGAGIAQHRYRARVRAVGERLARLQGVVERGLPTRPLRLLVSSEHDSAPGP